MKLLILILSIGALFAQTPKPVEPSKPKVIDKALALKFWRANALASQAETLSIKAALDHKAKAADTDTIFKEVKEFCGKDSTVNDSPTDGLVCEAKPITSTPTKSK